MPSQVSVDEPSFVASEWELETSSALDEQDRDPEPLDGRTPEQGKALRRPVVVIPIFPDGNPYWGESISGFTLEITPNGIAFEVNAHEWYPVKSIVIGVEAPERTRQYAGLEVLYTRPVEPNRIRIKGQFGGLPHEILQPETLTPTFRPASMEFALGFSDKVLRRWAEVGILRPVLCDRVQLCPRCLGLPTFRKGCRSCGSARTVNDQLIHHFACAHVGLVEDFDAAEGELVCPKCRTRGLVVNADFEFLTGPHHCQDCHWNDMALEEVGQCLRCGFRFPGQQAHQQELLGYHADRLDPLAYLAAP